MASVLSSQAMSPPPITADIRLRYAYQTQVVSAQVENMFDEQHRWLAGHLEDVMQSINAAKQARRQKKTANQPDLAALIKTPSRKRTQQKPKPKLIVASDPVTASPIVALSLALASAAPRPALSPSNSNSNFSPNRLASKSNSPSKGVASPRRVHGLGKENSDAREVSSLSSLSRSPSGKSKLAASPLRRPPFVKSLSFSDLASKHAEPASVESAKAPPPSLDPHPNLVIPSNAEENGGAPLLQANETNQPLAVPESPPDDASIEVHELSAIQEGCEDEGETPAQPFQSDASPAPVSLPQTSQVVAQTLPEKTEDIVGQPIVAPPENCEVDVGDESPTMTQPTQNTIPPKNPRLVEEPAADDVAKTIETGVEEAISALPAASADVSMSVPLNDAPSTLRNIHHSTGPASTRTPKSQASTSLLALSVPRTVPKSILPPSPSSTFFQSNTGTKIGAKSPARLNFGSSLALSRSLGRSAFDAAAVVGSQESATAASFATAPSSQPISQAESIVTQTTAASQARSSLKRASGGAELLDRGAPAKAAKSQDKLESVKEALNRMRLNRESMQVSTAAAPPATIPVIVSQPVVETQVVHEPAPLQSKPFVAQPVKENEVVHDPVPSKLTPLPTLPPTPLAKVAEVLPVPKATLEVPNDVNVTLDLDSAPQKPPKAGSLTKRSSVGDLVAKFESKRGGVEKEFLSQLEVLKGRRSGIATVPVFEAFVKSTTPTNSPPQIEVQHPVKLPILVEVPPVPTSKNVISDAFEGIDKYWNYADSPRQIEVEHPVPLATLVEVLPVTTSKTVISQTFHEHLEDFEASMGFADGMVLEEDPSLIDFKSDDDEKELDGEDGKTKTEFFDARTDDEVEETEKAATPLPPADLAERLGEAVNKYVIPTERECSLEEVTKNIDPLIDFDDEMTTQFQPNTDLAIKKTPSTASFQSTRSQTSGLTGLLHKAGNALSSSWGAAKASKTEVKSLQLAAAAAKKEQEGRDRRAKMRGEREERRIASQEKKQADERQKADEDRKVRLAELERRRKEREELQRKLAARTKTPTSRHVSEEPAKKRKGEPEVKTVDGKKSRAYGDDVMSQPPSSAFKPSASTSHFQPSRPVSVVGSSNTFQKAAAVVGVKSMNESIRVITQQQSSHIPTASRQIFGIPTSSSMASSSILKGAYQVSQAPCVAPSNTFPQPASTSSSHQQQQQSRVRVSEPVSEPYIELPSIASEYSEDDQEERDRRKKALPSWAQSPYLRNALEAQRRIDPSSIFGPIPELKMEEIFKGRSSRFRARTSSANWNGPDGLSTQEESDYARRMGYTQAR